MSVKVNGTESKPSCPQSGVYLITVAPGDEVEILRNSDTKWQGKAKRHHGIWLPISVK